MVEQKTQRKTYPSLAAAALLVGAIATIYLMRPKAEPDLQELLEVDRALNQGALEIQQRFERGDVEGVLQKNPKLCPQLGDLGQVHPFFLHCNPDYLQCYFEGRLGQVLSKVKAIKYPSGRFYRIVSRSLDRRPELPDYAVELILALDGVPFYRKYILLENSCRDTYLPRRIYSYGPLKRPGLTKQQRERIQKLEMTWDNYGRNLFLNKYLVTNREVREWKEITGQSILEHEKAFHASPALGLTPEQQESFCSFRGQHRMDAPIFDAATFLPDEKTKDARIIWRYPYPWGGDSQDELIAASSTYRWYDNSSTSWIEFNQILGDTLELMRNSIDSELNLKASSRHFPPDGLWHQLGRRAQWNGHEIKWEDSLNGEEMPRPSTDLAFKFGFRCYHSLHGDPP